MPLDDEDIRKIVQAVRAVLNAEQSVSGAIGERWTGGQLVMKPGKAGTQEKTVPIEAFFRKIVAVRERLRVLEQRINTHPKLTDEDRLQHAQALAHGDDLAEEGLDRDGLLLRAGL